MRALSIRQPWIWAILYGHKRIENRVDWSDCAFRGPVLLHAAQSVGSRRAFSEETDAVLDVLEEHLYDEGDARVTIAQPFAEPRDDLRGMRGETLWSPQPTLSRGGIVGRARIDGVLKGEADMVAYAGNRQDRKLQRAWWVGGFALILSDVEVLPFTPWKGQLGFFEVDERRLRAA